MPDEYNQGQVIKLTNTLTDPAAAEALTDDPTLALVAYREDMTQATVSAIQHPSTGIYTAQVTADVPGHWTITDHEGGVYRFYVKAVPQS